MTDQELANKLDEVHDKLDLILTAFPTKDGKPDPEAHRLYHEKVIAESAENAEIKKAIKIMVIKGTLSAVLVFLGTAAWLYLKSFLLRGGSHG